MNWLNANAPAIQALSAVAIVLLTLFLVLFAGGSLKSTDSALQLSRNQLKTQQESLDQLKRQVEDQRKALELSREEFEREWRPQMRISVDWPRGVEVLLIVANLGRSAVFVESIEIGVGVGTELRTEQIKWAQIVPVNESRSNNLYHFLLGAIGRLAGVNPQNFVGNLAASVQYFSAGQSYIADRIKFGIRIRENYVEEISPML